MLGAFRGGFHYDDSLTILENPHLGQLADLRRPSRSHGPAGLVRDLPVRSLTVWNEPSRLPSAESAAPSWFRIPHLPDSHSGRDGRNPHRPVLDRAPVSDPPDGNRNGDLHLRTGIGPDGVLLPLCVLFVYQGLGALGRREASPTVSVRLGRVISSCPSVPRKRR